MKIQTPAIDRINDQLEFYFDKENQLLTDDGYTISEIEELYMGVSKEDIHDLAESCCQSYFCQFDKSNEIFICRLTDSLDLEKAKIYLIQAITAFHTRYQIYEKVYLMLKGME